MARASDQLRIGLFFWSLKSFSFSDKPFPALKAHLSSPLLPQPGLRLPQRISALVSFWGIEGLSMK